MCTSSSQTTPDLRTSASDGQKTSPQLIAHRRRLLEGRRSDVSSRLVPRHQPGARARLPRRRLFDAARACTPARRRLASARAARRCFPQAQRLIAHTRVVSPADRTLVLLGKRSRSRVASASRREHRPGWTPPRFRPRRRPASDLRSPLLSDDQKSDDQKSETNGDERRRRTETNADATRSDAAVRPKSRRRRARVVSSPATHSTIFGHPMTKNPIRKPASKKTVRRPPRVEGRAPRGRAGRRARLGARGERDRERRRRRPRATFFRRRLLGGGGGRGTRAASTFVPRGALDRGRGGRAELQQLLERRNGFFAKKCASRSAHGAARDGAADAVLHVALRPRARLRKLLRKTTTR